MIKIVNTNLFNSTAEAYVNTVNCVGIMGKGIALEFRNRFPLYYKWYRDLCNQQLIKPGEPNIYVHSNDNPRYIISFPTKNHWRNPSKIEWIEKGLDILRELIIENNLKSISIPTLGCGNGGLDWNVVKPLIIDKLFNLETEIFLHEFHK